MTDEQPTPTLESLDAEIDVMNDHLEGHYQLLEFVMHTFALASPESRTMLLAPLRSLAAELSPTQRIPFQRIIRSLEDGPPSKPTFRLIEGGKAPPPNG